MSKLDIMLRCLRRTNTFAMLEMRTYSCTIAWKFSHIYNYGATIANSGNLAAINLLRACIGPNTS
jgi:hypothetical protein